MKYKGYLIDLDGTIYKGKDRIPAGEAFVHELQKARHPLSLCDQQYNPYPLRVFKKCWLRILLSIRLLSTVYTATLATYRLYE